MAIFQKPGPWQWQVVAVDKDRKTTVDFQRWLNSLLDNGLVLNVSKQDQDNDLDAIAAISGTGIAVRTGTDTWATRSITVGPGLTISNGGGIAGDPLIELVSSGGGGSAFAFDGGSASAGGRGFVLDGGDSGALSALNYWLDGGTA